MPPCWATCACSLSAAIWSSQFSLINSMSSLMNATRSPGLARTPELCSGKIERYWLFQDLDKWIGFQRIQELDRSALNRAVIHDKDFIPSVCGSKRYRSSSRPTTSPAFPLYDGPDIGAAGHLPR